MTFVKLYKNHRASLVAQTVKNPTAMQETWVRSLGWEDPLEKGKATHSSILAWRIPWTEEPVRPQSRGSQSDTTEQLSLSLFILVTVLETRALRELLRKLFLFFKEALLIIVQACA